MMTNVLFQVMTVGDYKGQKVQEVKKLIQKLLIDRVILHRFQSYSFHWLLNYSHVVCLLPCLMCCVLASIYCKVWGSESEC